MNSDQTNQLGDNFSTRRRLRVAVFSKIPIAPADGGNRAYVRSTCQNLLMLGCEVTFYLIPSRQLNNFDIHAHQNFFGNNNFEILKRSTIGYLLDISRLFWAIIVVRNLHRFLRRAFSIVRLRRNVDYTFPSALEPSIKTIAKQNRHDIVIVQYVHFSRIFASYDASVFKVLQTQDSFHNEFHKMAETKGLLRADKILATQEVEAENFRLNLGVEGDRVAIFSHIVELRPQICINGSRGATFIGSNMAANRASIDFFIKQILPSILRSAPHFKLFVVGSICNYIDSQDCIIKEGYVPNLETIFEKAPILINPIIEGTGIKIKLLDALSFGIPIVSTELGLQGIPEIYLRGIKVAPDDRPDKFAEYLLEVFSNQKMMLNLGHQNRCSADRWNESQLKSLKNVILEGKKFMRYRD